MIREHGPANSTMKLCLFALNAFMDEEGIAWPSQAKIATAASLTENTVQRQIAKAIELGWLGAKTIQTKTKGWKRLTYKASVPDALATCDTMLQDKVAMIVGKHESTFGPILEGGRPFKKKPPPHTKAVKAPVLNSEVPILNSKDSPPDAVSVPLPKSQVPSVNGTKSPSQAPTQSPHSKSPYYAAVLQNRAGAEGHETATDDEAKRLAKAIDTFPAYGNAELGKVLQMPMSKVRWMRKQAKTRMTGGS
jgi:hypothetical protein